MTDEEAVHWIIGMKVNDPDIYALFKPTMLINMNQLKSQEAKDFLKFVS
jgi:hypothetical protein